MKKVSINLVLEEKVIRFEEKNNHITHVITNKWSYKIDMTIISVGFHSQTNILKNKVEVIKNGTIKVNEQMQTSIKDIYAIGDSIILIHPLLGNYHITFATNATKSIVATIDLVGKKINFPGIVSTNGINVFGCYYTSTEISKTIAKALNL